MSNHARQGLINERTSLEDSVEDPIGEFHFMNEDSEEDERLIKRSLHDASRDMKRGRN